MKVSMLIYYAQKGYLPAKHALFSEFKNLIYKMCRKYYNKYPYIINWEEAENSAMNIFEVTILNYSFNSNVKFITFLSLQLKYYFSDLARQHFTNKAIASTFAIKKDYSEFSDNILGCEKLNPYHQILINDSITHYLKYLNEFEKKIIWLWAEGYSYKEIGEIYNKNIKWADNKICHIIRKLRKIK